MSEAISTHVCQITTSLCECLCLYPMSDDPDPFPCRLSKTHLPSVLPTVIFSATAATSWFTTLPSNSRTWPAGKFRSNSAFGKSPNTMGILHEAILNIRGYPHCVFEWGWPDWGVLFDCLDFFPFQPSSLKGQLDRQVRLHKWFGLQKPARKTYAAELQPAARCKWTRNYSTCA